MSAALLFAQILRGEVYMEPLVVFIIALMCAILVGRIERPEDWD